MSYLKRRGRCVMRLACTFIATRSSSQQVQLCALPPQRSRSLVKTFSTAQRASGCQGMCGAWTVAAVAKPREGHDSDYLILRSTELVLGCAQLNACLVHSEEFVAAAAAAVCTLRARVCLCACEVKGYFFCKWMVSMR